MKIIVGDCLEQLKSLDESSIDSIVTDPPYELNFMGKQWDNSGIVFKSDVWRECLRVLKPGGHMLVFGAPRTYHRVAVAVEDAGFEIRDCIMWVFGSGFPKSQKISAAIEKKSGDIEEVETWEGWGTALKPAYEPILVARKPLIGTVVANVLEHGVGGINIDACRIPTTDKLSGGPASSGQLMKGVGWHRPWMDDPDAVARNIERSKASVEKSEEMGRWPANLIHDGSEEVVDLFPEVKGDSPGRKPRISGKRQNGAATSFSMPAGRPAPTRSDTGSASRFFYCPKASKKDRGAGNNHPTVKPTELMKYLCRLVTPKGGTVLDPFMGSGSTGRGAVLEGFDFVGIELDAEYAKIAEARINDDLQ